MGKAEKTPAESATQAQFQCGRLDTLGMGSNEDRRSCLVESFGRPTNANYLLCIDTVGIP